MLKEEEDEEDRERDDGFDSIENDMSAAGVCVGDVKDRDKWRSGTTVVNPK